MGRGGAGTPPTGYRLVGGGDRLGDGPFCAGGPVGDPVPRGAGGPGHRRGEGPSAHRAGAGAGGEVAKPPRGQPAKVTTWPGGGAGAVGDARGPASADVPGVSDLRERVGAGAYADKELHGLLLDPPAVMGVESMDIDQFKIRMVARTAPGKQFLVGRALRPRITGALLHPGINVPADLETAEPTAAS